MFPVFVRSPSCLLFIERDGHSLLLDRATSLFRSWPCFDDFLSSLLFYSSSPFSFFCSVCSVCSVQGSLKIEYPEEEVPEIDHAKINDAIKRGLEFRERKQREKEQKKQEKS